MSRARSIDSVMDFLDELLLAKRWLEAAAAIEMMAYSDASVAIKLSALTISFPWHNEVSEARRILAEATRSQAFAVGGPDKVKEIERFLMIPAS